MSARIEYTSAQLARVAGRILRDPTATRREKSIAGSALTQARNRHRVARRRRAGRL